MAETSGGRGASEARLAWGGEGCTGGLGTSGRASPEPLAGSLFRKNCWVPGRSRKPCMPGMDRERGSPGNTGDLAEKRETSPRELNPGPICVNPGPRPKPLAREPKELILWAEQGIPQARIKKAVKNRIRGGILHLLGKSSTTPSVAQKGTAIVTETSNSSLQVVRNRLLLQRCKSTGSSVRAFAAIAEDPPSKVESSHQGGCFPRLMEGSPDTER
jgi:hypothetical protein